MNKKHFFICFTVTLILGFLFGWIARGNDLDKQYNFDCLNSYSPEMSYQKKKECAKKFGDNDFVHTMRLFELNLMVEHLDGTAISSLSGSERFKHVYPIILEKCFKENPNTCFYLKIRNNIETKKSSSVTSEDLLLEKYPEYDFLEKSSIQNDLTKIFSNHLELCNHPQYKVLNEKMNLNKSLKTMGLCIKK